MVSPRCWGQTRDGHHFCVQLVHVKSGLQLSQTLDPFSSVFSALTGGRSQLSLGMSKLETKTLWMQIRCCTGTVSWVDQVEH